MIFNKYFKNNFKKMLEKNPEMSERALVQNIYNTLKKEGLNYSEKKFKQDFKKKNLGYAVKNAFLEKAKKYTDIKEMDNLMRMYIINPEMGKKAFYNKEKNLDTHNHFSKFRKIIDRIESVYNGLLNIDCKGVENAQKSYQTCFVLDVNNLNSLIEKWDKNNYDKNYNPVSLLKKLFAGKELRKKEHNVLEHFMKFKPLQENIDESKYNTFKKLYILTDLSKTINFNDLINLCKDYDLRKIDDAVKGLENIINELSSYSNIIEQNKNNLVKKLIKKPDNKKTEVFNYITDKFLNEAKKSGMEKKYIELYSREFKEKHDFLELINNLNHHIDQIKIDKALEKDEEYNEIKLNSVLKQDLFFNLTPIEKEVFRIKPTMDNVDVNQIANKVESAGVSGDPEKIKKIIEEYENERD